MSGDYAAELLQAFCDLSVAEPLAAELPDLIALANGSDRIAVVDHDHLGSQLAEFCERFLKAAFEHQDSVKSE